MQKRRFILGILALGILAALILAFTRPREPSYKGRSLSHWVQRYFQGRSWDYGQDVEADEAVQHIGTNAIPYLLAWLRTEEPAWQPKWKELTDRLPEPIRPKKQFPVRYGVPGAFGALGAEARTALPELTKLAHDTNHLATAFLATWALGKIKLEDIWPLATVLTNGFTFIKDAAWVGIRRQGTNAEVAIPFLVGCFKAKPSERGAEVFGALALKPDLVVPALTDALSNRSDHVRLAAAQALGNYGPQARSAVPQLRRLLGDPFQPVARTARAALTKIAPEALTNAPSR
jgi:HEAT repeat protein